MGSGFDPWILRKGACPCTGLSQLNQKQSFSTLNGTSREEPIARRRVAVPGAGSCPRHFPSAPQIRVATGVIRPLSRRQRVADHLFDPLPSTPSYPILSHPPPSHLTLRPPSLTVDIQHLIPVIAHQVGVSIPHRHGQQSVAVSDLVRGIRNRKKKALFFARRARRVAWVDGGME